MDKQSTDNNTLPCSGKTWPPDTDNLPVEDDDNKTIIRSALNERWNDFNAAAFSSRSYNAENIEKLLYDTYAYFDKFCPDGKADGRDLFLFRNISVFGSQCENALPDFEDFECEVFKDVSEQLVSLIIMNLRKKADAEIGFKEEIINRADENADTFSLSSYAGFADGFDKYLKAARENQIEDNLTEFDYIEYPEDRLVIDTESWEILKFDRHFREELIIKMLIEAEITEEQFAAFAENSPEASVLCSYTAGDICRALSIAITNGKIGYDRKSSMTKDDVLLLMEIVEYLGFSFDGCPVIYLHDFNAEYVSSFPFIAGWA